MNIVQAKRPKITALWSCVLTGSSWMCSAQGTTPGNSFELSMEQWRQDIRAMQADMPKLHKNLFHDMTQDQFNQAVNALLADVASLNQDQIVVRMMQITAMVRDGHSGIDIAMREGVTHVALRISRYPDGIFVRAAPAVNAQAVGARIVRVGGVSWQEAMKRIDSVVACDPSNDGERWAWQPQLHLTDPLVLHGLGLTESNKLITYTLEKDGKEFDLTLMPSLNGLGYFATARRAIGWMQGALKERNRSYIHGPA